MTTGQEVETVFVLSQDQYHALVNHAINDLMMKGIITTMELPTEEANKMKQEALEEAQKMFLEQANTETLPQA